VGAGKTIFVPIIAMDIELAEPIHTLKLLETVEWNLAGTRDELQQFGSLFLIERANCTPEPLYLRRGGRVVVILSAVFPIVHVNFGKTRNQQLQFLFVEDGDKLRRNDIMET
jgi:hypothetical protein